MNWKANQLLLFEFWRPEAIEAVSPRSWYLFEPMANGQGYQLRQIQAEVLKDINPYNIVPYDLPDIYLRTTQKRGLEEFWGYRIEDPNGVDLNLRKVTLKPDLTGFVKEDVDFPHHKNFVDVGYFDVQDIDGDGLDEVILVEETAGKIEAGDENVYFSDIKDYVRILKWNGKEYLTMWVSPPYTKRGTKFLVEDIKNTGKKQLVVLSPYGTIQIWEKE